MEYIGYIVFGTAFLCSGWFFWCTYRHIHEPVGGRPEESNVSEVRKINAALDLERRSYRIDDEVHTG